MPKMVYRSPLLQQLRLRLHIPLQSDHSSSRSRACALCTALPPATGYHPIQESTFPDLGVSSSFVLKLIWYSECILVYQQAKGPVACVTVTSLCFVDMREGQAFPFHRRRQIFLVRATGLETRALYTSTNHPRQYWQAGRHSLCWGCFVPWVWPIVLAGIRPHAIP